MSKNLIITIGRQYGSGGREIGERLAERLGYDYYDTVLLEKASQGSGLSEDVIARYDERLTDKWMNASLGMSGATEHHKLPLPLRVAFGQFEEIRKIGKRGRAVIVGRCADQILKEQANVFSAFIYADMDLRIERVANRNHISVDEAKNAYETPIKTEQIITPTIQMRNGERRIITTFALTAAFLE